MNRRPSPRFNRGRIATRTAAVAPPFATVSAPTTANEGADPAVSAVTGNAALSLTLKDTSPAVPVNVRTGITTPYSTTYPDVTPGTRTLVWVNEAGGAQTPPVTITVAAQAATISAPTNGQSFNAGQVITFTADGTADGWDANTTKVEFYVAGVLKATANSATAGAWTATWDSSGYTPATGVVVLAKRYWVGLAGETGTVDSATITIDVTPFATISTSGTANEGADPTVTATTNVTTLSLTLKDTSPAVAVSVRTGITTPYSTTYPDMTPGTRTLLWMNESGGAVTASTNVTVTAQAATISSPTNGQSFSAGTTVTFTADGTADGWDANTTKVEFYVAGVLKATANSATGGVWTTTWDTTGYTPATGIVVLAKRYWVGLAGETGTVDSATITIDITSAVSTPATIMGANCQEWWRADLGNTIATDGNWVGQKNGLVLAQATAGARPAQNATGGPNSTASMLLDGVDDTLTVTISRSTPSIIWAVMRQVTAGWTSNEPIFHDASVAFVILQRTASPQIAMYNTSFVNNNSAAVLNTWGRLYAKFTNSTSDALQFIATTVTGANAGNLTGTVLRIGWNGSAFGKFELCELGIFNAVPSAGQITSLDSYVTSRYGSGLV